MKEEQRIIAEVIAALEQEPDVNLHQYPVQVGFVDGTLILEAELEHIKAKKRALAVASAVSGVGGIIDRLHLAPAERMQDGEIRDRVRNALLAENLLAPAAVRVIVKGEPEWIRIGDDGGGCIDVEVTGGIVLLNGTVSSLSAKRLAGVMAWWVPGSRDVINGLEVAPPEEDHDDEVIDAVRLVLEKDPFVNVGQVRVSCSNYMVTLDGLVRNDTERQMAESDCWYVFRVNGVRNKLLVEE